MHNTVSVIIITITLKGTHAQVVGYLWKDHYDWAKEKRTAWYRSKEPVNRERPGGGCGYLSNKKWPLIEVLHKGLH